MATDAQPTPSTLPLCDVSFAFYPVPLLSSGRFRDEARSKWGQRASIEDLERVHQLGLLFPLKRADDDRETVALPVKSPLCRNASSSWAPSRSKNT